MPKVLGVDFGDRRTGVAISDDSRVIAFPRETLDCPRLEQAAAAEALHRRHAWNVHQLMDEYFPLEED